MTAKDVAGVALVALALCLGAGAFYAAAVLRPAKLNAETLCPAGGPLAATWIIIDKTEPLSQADRQAISDTVVTERDGLAMGEAIGLAVIEQEAAARRVGLRELIFLCNPGVSGNPLFQNAKRIERTYRSAFDAPLRQAMEDALEKGSAPTSPIAAGLAEVLGAQSSRAVPKLKVVLLSDLMEHAGEGSAYDGTFSEKTLARAFAGAPEETLAKASVEIIAIARPKLAAKQEKAKAVWQGFLKARARQIVVRQGPAS